MKKILVKSGKWLIQKFDSAQNAYVIVLDSALVTKAGKVVLEVAADIEGASGENKRHRAFALLCRAAPEANHRDISKAIEVALDHVG